MMYANSKKVRPIQKEKGHCESRSIYGVKFRCLTSSPYIQYDCGVASSFSLYLPQSAQCFNATAIPHTLALKKSFFKNQNSSGRKLEENYTIAEINQAFSVKKEYDLGGNKTKIIYPSGRAIERMYDPLSRLTKIIDKTNQFRQLAEYRYKGLNLESILFGTTQVPVVSTIFEYDPEK